MRARVGRKNKLIPKSTITFIRNKRRDAFTFIREDGTIEELTFLEAVKEFEARLEEKSIPLHDKHHEQVAKALEVFSEKEEKDKATVNKLRNATKKTPINPVVLLEQLMKIITVYPLESVKMYDNIQQTVNVKQKKELHPEIIISESFNI